MKKSKCAAAQLNQLGDMENQPGWIVVHKHRITKQNWRGFSEALGSSSRSLGMELKRLLSRLAASGTQRTEHIIYEYF